MLTWNIRLGSSQIGIENMALALEWTKNAQIWPRAMNSELGGEEGGIYLVAQDNGQQSGQGLDFINGFVWREFSFHSPSVL